MAVIKAVNSRASLARAVNYITGGEKTERTLDVYKRQVCGIIKAETITTVEVRLNGS